MTLLARFATDLGPEPLSPSPTPTTPANPTAGGGYGVDPTTIAIAVAALLVIAGVMWFLARRRS